jgi:hypothetical protein
MKTLVLLAGLMCANAAIAETSPARQLYVRKCAGCHKLYDPSRYNEADWDKWLGKMQRKARLSDAQVEQLRTLRPATP